MATEGTSRLAELSACKLVASSNVSATRVGDETVLLHLTRGMYFGFDPIGTRVWEGLAEDRELAEICVDISNEFTVELRTVESDVATFVSDLLENEILEAAGGERPK